MAEHARLSVVLLWHFHQPDYRHPERGAPVLPWVRLHAVRGYTDMVAALERHPDVRVTLNFVPVLLDQWQALVDGQEDEWLTRCRQDPAHLDHGARAELAALLSCAQPRTMIAPLPRYRELHERRQEALARGEEAVFDAAELTDLLVLFHLAWSGHRLRQQPEVQALVERGRDFSLADRDRLLELHRDEVRGLIDRVRRLAERGQVELSTTPWNHPILPLLCALDSRDHADEDEGEPFRFAWPEDARWHVRQAQQGHQRWFGQAPAGMWPAEGAVSEAAAEQFAAAGVRWIASDEEILFRSLDPGADPAVRYRPWRRATPAGEVALLFRDHELSDRIGFAYQEQPADQAADDFVGRLEEIRREAGDGAVVTVILDGENPWEHYPDAGAPFLDALYARLSAHPDLRTATPSQVLDEQAGDLLPGLATGSWIDGTLATWAGHPEKRNAWRLLAALRAAAGPGALATGGEGLTGHLQVLEGSDWYWWLGDDHETALAEVFDDLFLAHLRQGWRALGRPVPVLPALRDQAPTAPRRLPTGRVRPTGQPADTLQWEGAGSFVVRPSGGAMTAAEALAERVCFGWDGDVWHLGVLAAPAVTVSLHLAEAAAPAAACGESFLHGRALAWFQGPRPTGGDLHFHLELRRGDREAQRWPGRGMARIPGPGRRPGVV